MQTTKSYHWIRSKPKYHIDIECFLRIPANIYWKNTLGIHLGCNQQTAEDTGFLSPQDYVGLTIFDISNKKCAQIIHSIDQQIIKTQKPNCFIETSGALYSEQAAYLSIKSPLFNDKGKTVGLFGMSFKINDTRFLNISQLLYDIKIENGFSLVSNSILKYYSSHQELKTAKLTKRETIILFHLCQGKTAKKIAESLSLSERTIETHIDNIKTKTNCNSKYELITKYSIMNDINNNHWDL